MRILTVNRVFLCLALLCAAACTGVPAAADNGTISIAYRGSGGGYIGDTFVFDGKDTYGSTVLLKVHGPGLPADGVPINNLNGPAGTGTPVKVDRYGAWKFAWYGSSVAGIDRMQTARYTFTATDSENPEKSATTSVMLKKAEFSITASPNPANPGDYISVTGNTEQDLTSMTLEIADASGTVLHSFTSPVGAQGYFNYGFHGDMGPGQYTVTASNPVLKTPYRTILTVAAATTTLDAAVVTTPVQVTVPVTSEAATPSTPSMPVTADTTKAKSPLEASTLISALTLSVAILVVSRR